MGVLALTTVVLPPFREEAPVALAYLTCKLSHRVIVHWAATTAAILLFPQEPAHGDKPPISGGS
jgi:hypothetical protein